MSRKIKYMKLGIAQDFDYTVNNGTGTNFDCFQNKFNAFKKYSDMNMLMFTFVFSCTKNNITKKVATTIPLLTWLSELENTWHNYLITTDFGKLQSGFPKSTYTIWMYQKPNGGPLRIEMWSNENSQGNAPIKLKRIHITNMGGYSTSAQGGERETNGK